MDSNLVKSRLLVTTYCSLMKSFSNLAQSTEVLIPCPANFKTILATVMDVLHQRVFTIYKFGLSFGRIVCYAIIPDNTNILSVICHSLSPCRLTLGWVMGISSARAAWCIQTALKYRRCVAKFTCMRETYHMKMRPISLCTGYSSIHFTKSFPTFNFNSK